MKLDELNKAYEEELEEQKKETEEMNEPKPRSKGKWIMLIAAVLILSTTAFAISSKFKGNTAADEAETAGIAAEGAIMNGLPEGMKEGELGDALQQKIDESMFTVNVNSQPIFQNGTSKGKVDIVNSPGNSYPCTVALTLDEDGTELYRSDDLIYPEQYIPTIKLSKNLPKGAYPATLTYYVYDADGKEVTGTMKAAMNIVIQN